VSGDARACDPEKHSRHASHLSLIGKNPSRAGLWLTFLGRKADKGALRSLDLFATTSFCASAEEGLCDFFHNSRRLGPFDLRTRRKERMVSAPFFVLIMKSFATASRGRVLRGRVGPDVGRDGAWTEAVGGC
jgi:hypothetical protein